MIKLNFEFDSKDPISAQFFDWISAFPLDKSAVKVTTSVDYLDPSSDAAEPSAHRIGNIILEFSPDDTKYCDTSDNDPILKSESDFNDSFAEPTTDKQQACMTDPDSKKMTDPDSNINKTDLSEGPESDDTLINADSFSEMSATIVSTEAAFESDLDESLLAAVAFADADQPEESIEQEDHSENISPEKNGPESEIISSSTINQEEESTEDLDFLLNSLDEFNN